jgi:hypothetical protein
VYGTKQTVRGGKTYCKVFDLKRHLVVSNSRVGQEAKAIRLFSREKGALHGCKKIHFESLFLLGRSLIPSQTQRSS